jgi:hypothetical protein
MYSLPKSKGNTLIGILIAIGLLTILTTVIIGLIATIYQLTGFTKARTTAKHVAQERIELIRNMSYDDIGTVSGIPPGSIEQSENISINGQAYHIETEIVYFDDPFDELAPTDTEPTDYKKATVTVSWGNIVEPVNPIVLTTNISTASGEALENTGTLKITVFDANGLPISLADVSVYTDVVDPIVDLDLQTDLNGEIELPGTPVCVNCYEITVTKDEFSTDRTYSDAEVENPAKPHVTVIDNDLTEVSFSIDTLSDVNITSYGTRGSGFPLAGNVAFRMRGDKVIGTDAGNNPVYKYDNNLSTDGLGNLAAEDIEWDNYIQAPIKDVDATLTSYDNPGTEVAGLSGLDTDPDWGHLLLNNLDEGNYRLDATASGYLDISADVYVTSQVRDEYIMQLE